VTTLQNSVASLTSQLATANNTISTQTATIATLNSAISSLNATIATMVATPVAMSVSATTAAVSTPITVTVTFPDSSQDSKTVTFTSPGGGSFTPASATVVGTTATTSFSSASPGTYNINAVEGMYAGGATVTITAPTYSISGTITLNYVGQSGVIVALTGAATGAATTDANGNYSFAGLQNGSYTVTPWPGSYNYPASTLSVTINNANATGENFGNRWIDINNGTLTDVTTGLVWLKNANCAGSMIWANAGTWAAGLANGACGLTDGSAAGSWRVPTKSEFAAITSGTAAVSYFTPQSFINIQLAPFYWSSTNYDSNNSWAENFSTSTLVSEPNQAQLYVLPVRNGP
jgi:hypothetical protein